MYIQVHVSPYCYIRFRVAGKGSQTDVQENSLILHGVNITLFWGLNKVSGVPHPPLKVLQSLQASTRGLLLEFY